MLSSLLPYFLKTLTSLFSIINPLGAMPVFMAMTMMHAKDYRSLMARKASFWMVMILIFFLFAGTFIMSFFGITMESLRIAGGLIVTRSGFLLLGTGDEPEISEPAKEEAKAKADISLTPLALPLLSGPGSIAATISMATQARFHVPLVKLGSYIISAQHLIILLSIVCVGIITWIILRLSQTLLPVFGKSGLEATTKLMGFISMTVGVQFIITGVQEFLKRVHLIWY